MATEIAARDESGTTDERSITHVTTMIHHAHLPLLAEVGVIDYDPETHRIDPDTVLMDAYRRR